MIKYVAAATFAALVGFPLTASADAPPGDLNGSRITGITVTIDCDGHLVGETSFAAEQPAAAIVLSVHDGDRVTVSSLVDVEPGHYPFTGTQVHVAAGDTVEVWASFVFEGAATLSTPVATVTAPSCWR